MIKDVKSRDVLQCQCSGTVSSSSYQPKHPYKNTTGVKTFILVVKTTSATMLSTLLWQLSAIKTTKGTYLGFKCVICVIYEWPLMGKFCDSLSYFLSLNDDKK